jgi:hypothetical protein
LCSPVCAARCRAGGRGKRARLARGGPCLDDGRGGCHCRCCVGLDLAANCPVEGQAGAINALLNGTRHRRFDFGTPLAATRAATRPSAYVSQAVPVCARLGCAVSRPAPHRNQRPDRLHNTERPSPLQESVEGCQHASPGKSEGEPMAAIFEGVTNHHRRYCKQPEQGELIHPSKRTQTPSGVNSSSFAVAFTNGELPAPLRQAGGAED